MAEIRTVTRLRSKRDEIAGTVEKYERLLAQARADLAHIEAAISIFEASGDPKGFPAYVDVASFNLCFRNAAARSAHSSSEARFKGAPRFRCRAASGVTASGGGA